MLFPAKHGTENIHILSFLNISQAGLLYFYGQAVVLFGFHFADSKKIFFYSILWKS